MTMSGYNVETTYPLMNNSKHIYSSMSSNHNPGDYYNSYYRNTGSSTSNTSGNNNNSNSNNSANNNRSSGNQAYPANNSTQMFGYSSEFYPLNSQENGNAVFQHPQYFTPSSNTSATSQMPHSSTSTSSYNSTFSYPNSQLVALAQTERSSADSNNSQYQTPSKKYSYPPAPNNWQMNYSNGNVMNNSNLNMTSQNSQGVPVHYPSQNETSLGQPLSYYNQVPKQVNVTPTQYTGSHNPGSNSSHANLTFPSQSSYYSFNDNYYHQSYGQSAPNSATCMNIKSDRFFPDLSPTVVEFPQPKSATIERTHRQEDRIDENPIPLNLSYNEKFMGNPQQQQTFNAKEVFRTFENRLKNSTHVKLLRINTLPKEEISKNITVIENNNKKVYFNFEYPTVSISFQQPINDVTLNWTEQEKIHDRRKLVFFYWDFSLVKANHVINNSINRDGPAAGGFYNSSNNNFNSSPDATEFFNENLEYIKSILHLKYLTISQAEYQYFFDTKRKKNSDGLDANRLQFLSSIIKNPTTNTINNNFCLISCLYWTHTQDFYLTSVDLLFLLDKLSGRTTNITNSITNAKVNAALMSSKPESGKKSKYASKVEAKRLKQAAKLLKLDDSKEINRIRRNLLNFKSITLGKAEADEELASVAQGTNNDFGTEEELEFFHVIMGFEDPKPRKIEKKLKVYEWKILEQALDKIMKKYCVDLKTDSQLVSTPAPMEYNAPSGYFA